MGLLKTGHLFCIWGVPSFYLSSPLSISELFWFVLPIYRNNGIVKCAKMVCLVPLSGAPSSFFTKANNAKSFSCPIGLVIRNEFINQIMRTVKARTFEKRGQVKRQVISFSKVDRC